MQWRMFALTSIPRWVNYWYSGPLILRDLSIFHVWYISFHKWPICMHECMNCKLTRHIVVRNVTCDIHRNCMLWYSIYHTVHHDVFNILCIMQTEWRPLQTIRYQHPCIRITVWWNCVHSSARALGHTGGIEPLIPHTMTAIALHPFGLPPYRLRHRALDKNPSPRDALYGMETNRGKMFKWYLPYCNNCWWSYHGHASRPLSRIMLKADNANQNACRYCSVCLLGVAGPITYHLSSKYHTDSFIIIISSFRSSPTQVNIDVPDNPTCRVAVGSYTHVIITWHGKLRPTLSKQSAAIKRLSVN